MKKTIITVVAAVLVVSLIATGIFVFTAKESKQLTLENLNTFYDVKIEITDYVKGEKATEILGVLATYEPSAAKIHVTLTPKSDITCDGGQLLLIFEDNFWQVKNGGKIIQVPISQEEPTDIYVDLISDYKVTQADAPENDSVKLDGALGTITYKKFFQ